jgi:hypothetical protein
MGIEGTSMTLGLELESDAVYYTSRYKLELEFFALDAAGGKR